MIMPCPSHIPLAFSTPPHTLQRFNLDPEATEAMLEEVGFHPNIVVMGSVNRIPHGEGPNGTEVGGEPMGRGPTGQRWEGSQWGGDPGDRGAAAGVIP